MNTIFHRLFRKKGTSANDAKARLKVLLVHDEVQLSPAELQQMKDEILQVVAKYVDVEEDGVDVKLRKEEGQVALSANVPVRRALA